MKREEIQSKIPGITKEQLDWLMDENGKDVTREKATATQLQTQLNEANAQLQTAKDGLKAFEGVNVAELQGKIQQLTADMAAQKDAFEFDSAVDGAIRDAKGRNVNAIRGMMDLAALKASKDRTADIKAALAKLSEENAWAFESAAAAASVLEPHLARGDGLPQGNPEMFSNRGSAARSPAARIRSLLRITIFPLDFSSNRAKVKKI
jgi:hypothetical protein